MKALQAETQEERAAREAKEERIKKIFRIQTKERNIKYLMPQPGHRKAKAQIQTANL